MCVLIFLSLTGSPSESGGRAHGGSRGESEETTSQKHSGAGGGQEVDPAAELQQKQR